VTPVDAADQPFDPHLHDAVMRDEDVPTAEQTHVVQELQRGYKIHERVLRPALVKVGRAPSTQSPETTEADVIPEPTAEA
jgi:molecular chaperone GrpE